jgi:hypothetical protein
MCGMNCSTQEAQGARIQAAHTRLTLSAPLIQWSVLMNVVVQLGHVAAKHALDKQGAVTSHSWPHQDTQGKRSSATEKLHSTAPSASSTFAL